MALYRISIARPYDVTFRKLDRVQKCSDCRASVHVYEGTRTRRRYLAVCWDQEYVRMGSSRCGGTLFNGKRCTATLQIIRRARTGRLEMEPCERCFNRWTPVLFTPPPVRVNLLGRSGERPA